jgi:hypothetical protein
LELDVVGGRIQDLKLRIYEPPRLFEKRVSGSKLTNKGEFDG